MFFVELVISSLSALRFTEKEIDNQQQKIVARIERTSDLT